MVGETVQVSSDNESALTGVASPLRAVAAPQRMANLAPADHSPQFMVVRVTYVCMTLVCVAAPRRAGVAARDWTPSVVAAASPDPKIVRVPALARACRALRAAQAQRLLKLFLPVREPKVSFPDSAICPAPVPAGSAARQNRQNLHLESLLPQTSADIFILASVVIVKEKKYVNFFRGAYPWWPNQKD